MPSLPIFVRLAGRPVILLGNGDAAAAKHRLLERAGATIVDESATAALAIVAIGEDAEAGAAIARLKARGILVNAVDRSADCDFTLPAIVDRSPVLIAVGTGGASAGLAKALRQRLEALLPAQLGAIATGLAAARAAIRTRWPEPSTRRRAIDAAFDPGGPLDPFIAHEDDAVATWLASAGAVNAATRLVPLALTSPDPDALTLRQARLLAQADTLFHTAAVPRAILDRARADAARVEAETRPDALPPGLALFVTMEMQ
ncbi:NAD(P)-dependent oxidoreductase [Sphingomonas zeicaulis]|uniref:precorrin-2 dehydrogenase/sirohydrochlorin ferrochelatase family protein n=1 Tax=Sphingomonas zeicaulis TaxID=1632740 RepID=UPI003D1D069A